jgi:hypothetical protein
VFLSSINRSQGFALTSSLLAQVIFSSRRAYSILKYELAAKGSVIAFPLSGLVL